MKQRFLTVLGILFFFNQLGTAYSAVTIHQSSSSLNISWDQLNIQRWQILNEDGTECWQERVTDQNGSFDISKIAFDKKRQLILHTSEGTKNYNLDAKINLSPLAKVHNNAVIYQLPVRTWSADGVGENLSGHLNKIDHTVLEKIKTLGADYIWMTGIVESASYKQTDPDVVKGNAGSYYAIHDSWDVNEEIGGLKAFEDFITRSHQHGLRVIIDLVPNHTARSHRTDVKCKNLIDFGVHDQNNTFFNAQNNFYYLPQTTFKAPYQPGKEGADGQFDQDIFRSGIQFEAPARVTGNDIINASPSVNDWFETTKLNYGFDLKTRTPHYSPIPNTWIKVLDIAKYWTAKGVDGFRLDFAHSVPMEFWRYFAANLKNHSPEVFLLAEGYERDEAMKLPGYSNKAMLQAGFDSVYHSEIYWGLRHQQIGSDILADLDNPLSHEGKALTNYMENHDEIRVAAHSFASHLGNKFERAQIGLHFSAWLALMPNHFLMHGGQELAEEAEIYGPFAGNNGRTSIFDFVYQTEVKKWRYNQSEDKVLAVRSSYEKLLNLKHNAPFNTAHTKDNPSYMDLSRLNIEQGANSKILSYIRYTGDQKYLIVVNTDMYNSQEATIHFTKNTGTDSKGALAALGIKNDSTWYEFKDVMFRPNWIPNDPAYNRSGVPGWALYRNAGVPSGLYLGRMPAGQTYVFKIN